MDIKICIQLCTVFWIWIKTLINYWPQLTLTWILLLSVKKPGSLTADLSINRKCFDHTDHSSLCLFSPVEENTPVRCNIWWQQMHANSAAVPPARYLTSCFPKCFLWDANERFSSVPKKEKVPEWKQRGKCWDKHALHCQMRIQQHFFYKTLMSISQERSYGVQHYGKCFLHFGLLEIPQSELVFIAIPDIFPPLALLMTSGDRTDLRRRTTFSVTRSIRLMIAVFRFSLKF